MQNIVENSVVVSMCNYTAPDWPDGDRLTVANITRDLGIVNTYILVQRK